MKNEHMIKKRYLQSFIEKDLKEKMVFIGGPRQVGKMTLARFVGSEVYGKFLYVNWDNSEDRRKIIRSQIAAEFPLVIYDEIHKYRQWKNYIKGQFDTYKDYFSILVTGSARLDLYKKGGDSLMGRYYYFRLHPFSVAEVLGKHHKIVLMKKLEFFSVSNSRDIFLQLMKFGGFPEPFLKKDENILRRWHNQRIERLVKEDIRDIENIRELSILQILVEILPAKIGSPLSLNALREDLQVAFGTVRKWMDVLEKFYYHFRLYPFSVSAIRSLRKESKLYLWDWSQAEHESARLENIVASHLLKLCHFFSDTEGHKAELFYLRDIEGREVDFLVTIGKKPWLAVEVKNSDLNVSKHLNYFGKKLKIPFQYQVVHKENIDFFQDGIRIISVDKFLGGLV